MDDDQGARENELPQRLCDAALHNVDTFGALTQHVRHGRPLGEALQASHARVVGHIAEACARMKVTAPPALAWPESLDTDLTPAQLDAYLNTLVLYDRVMDLVMRWMLTAGLSFSIVVGK